MSGEEENLVRSSGSEWSYREAYSIFRDRTFSYSLHEDCTRLIVPFKVITKEYDLPPETCFVRLDEVSNKVQLFWPWLRTMKEEVTEQLDGNEIWWINKFIEHRGARLNNSDDRNESIWLMPQGDFQALQTLCRAKPTERNRIISYVKPDHPTEALLIALEAIDAHVPKLKQTPQSDHG